MSYRFLILSVFALVLFFPLSQAFSQSCSSDADCTDPSKPQCGMDGMCQALPIACQTDADCTDPEFPICGPDQMCIAEMDTASLTINNVTIPSGLENIEYSGAGANPYPAGCAFQAGNVFLNDGESVTCDNLPVPGTYAVIEVNGPFTAELSCNLPVTPQVPGVISFTRSMEPDDDLVCTITNTAIPLNLNPIIPNIAGIMNQISFDDAGAERDVAIFFGFHPGDGSYDLTKSCFGTPIALTDPRLLGIVSADSSGSGAFNFFLPFVAFGRTVGLQAISLDHCITSNAFPQLLGSGGDS